MKRANMLFTLIFFCLFLSTIVPSSQGQINRMGPGELVTQEPPKKDIGYPQSLGGDIILSGDCTDYIDLTGQPLPITVTGTTVGATNNYGPFNSRPSCWPYGWWPPSAAARDVTYKWTVPANGRYTISLCNSSYDTALLLYDFTCPIEPVYPDDLICGNDDYCGQQSELNGYWFAGGQEILIVVDGYGGGMGLYSLEISAYKAASIDSFLVEAMDTHHIPGMAACVVKDGEIVWTGAYGYANIEENIEVADTTLFTIASVSKTITGVALMQLWEQGLFDLDDDINHYLPAELYVSNPYYPDDLITVRMLLTHTSSINDNWSVLNPLISWGSDSSIPMDTFLVNYLVPGGYYYSGLNFNNQQPGTQWDYSNVAITLVGYLVETLSDAITGISFGQHCQDSIFTPLSMYETSWFLIDLNTNNIAMPYDWNSYTYIPYGHYGCPIYPASMLKSSTPQLSRFLIAFMQYGQIDGVRILDSTTVEMMTTIQPGIDPPPNDWQHKQGLIWLYCNFSGRHVWGHTGGWYGIRTSMFYMPEENAGIIVLTNRWVSIEDFLAVVVHELLEYASGWPYGSIAGVVSDQSMNPIEGVLVETVGPGTSDNTNSGGEYLLQYLRPGTYDISFSHSNYYDTIVTSVIVAAEETTILNVELRSLCAYIAGDCDHNGIALELGDVIAMIGIYRGTIEPYYACDCPPHGNEFAAEADPNGNCVAFEVVDVVTEIAAYRGTGQASGCEDCPGSGGLLPGGEDLPLVMPILKSKVKISKAKTAD